MGGRGCGHMVQYIPAEGKKYLFCGICGHFSAMDLIFSAAMLYWIS